MRRLFLSIGSSFAALAAPGADMAEPEPPRPAVTRDRLEPDRLARWVQPAMARVEAGDLEGGRRIFERLLAMAPPEKEGDLLTAFGVTLYHHGLETGDDALRRASIPYLERAVPATERRFGAEHPEVALALHSFADAQIELEPDDPPLSVDEALRRAHRIRIRTLGPNNVETASGMRGLAEIMGLPSRTGGDPARIAEAAALLEQVARTREALPDLGIFESPESARFAVARIYVRNGLPAEALAAVAAAEAAFRERGGDPCELFILRLGLAEDFREQGYEAQAEALWADDPCGPPLPIDPID